MKKAILLAALAATAMGTAAVMAAQQPAGPPPPMTFFAASENGTGNLGGLAGADARCQRLAQAAGSPATRTWHAYLSTQGAGAVNARDRIGAGPWHNAKGVIMATNVADLHGDVERDRNNFRKPNVLNEKGEEIGGFGNMPNEHDILTGSDSHGRAFGAAVTEDRTCRNWTYDGDENSHAQVGHTDRLGGANASWNSVHVTPGCSVASLARVGGAGKLYCFAIN